MILSRSCIGHKDQNRYLLDNNFIELEIALAPNYIFICGCRVLERINCNTIAKPTDINRRTKLWLLKTRQFNGLLHFQMCNQTQTNIIDNQTEIKTTTIEDKLIPKLICNLLLSQT